MSEFEEEACQLVAEAKRKLSSKSFFHYFFGDKNGKEEAADCYYRAANLFKVAKNWEQAGEAFRSAADLNYEQNNKGESANYLVLASKCYQKSNFDVAISCLLAAIQIYIESGKFSMAAKYHQTIGELYEFNDFVKSMRHYEEAANYFNVEENGSQARKCLLKVALFATRLEDYEKAIEIYHDVGLADLKRSILQYSAKDNFFRAVLCHLCVDIMGARQAIEFYVDKFPAFEISRECQFLKKIIKNIETGDEDKFDSDINEYNISHMDNWYASILLKIKQKIRKYPDLR